LKQGFTLVDYTDIQMYEMPRFNRTGLVSHGFTARTGGSGRAPYNTLNLALHVGDVPETVLANRRIVCRVLGVQLENMVTARQVHGVNIRTISSADAGRGAFTYDNAIADTDGLITNVPGLMLATFYADCVPIFILDPVKKAIGSIHAGWQGTMRRIGAYAVKKMADVFGSNPEDCLVGIGPSIGPCCFEVDNPVIAGFRAEFSWSDQILESNRAERTRLNLWKANLNILVEAGIKPNNVQLANICTCCSPGLMFSYRGENGTTGRMGAFIMLKSEN
jgi:YfiH family protein